MRFEMNRDYLEKGESLENLASKLEEICCDFIGTITDVVDGTVDASKKIVANDHSNQANDNSTLIVNNGNPNDAKVRLALKIEELEAEKQKWIGDKLSKYGVLVSTDTMIKLVHTQHNARYDARLASLRKAL